MDSQVAKTQRREVQPGKEGPSGFERRKGPLFSCYLWGRGARIFVITCRVFFFFFSTNAFDLKLLGGFCGVHCSRLHGSGPWALADRTLALKPSPTPHPPCFPLPGRADIPRMCLLPTRPHQGFEWAVELMNGLLAGGRAGE